MPTRVDDPRRLRVALFSGNYNYVRDGANQALNRLVEYLLRRGAAVRVYSPTSENPSFEPVGDLVSVPSVPVPFGRGEYRIAWPIPRHTQDDLSAFRPNVCHISLPIFLGSSALKLSRRMGVPTVASMHTRFETYPSYYGLGMLEGPITGLLRRFYNQCDAVVAPSESAARMMELQGMSEGVRIWTRGIDTDIFHPSRRSFEWRRQHGFADTDVVIAFLGRLVMEKGLEVVAATIERLKARGVDHKMLVIGEGPAREWLTNRMPDAVFVGHQSGPALGTAIASAEILFNPSTTETFGNVTLEAMASGLPVVAANAPGSSSLVCHGRTGLLVPPGDIEGFAHGLQHYLGDRTLRFTDGRAALRASEAYEWDSVNEAMIEAYFVAQRLASQCKTTPAPLFAWGHRKSAKSYGRRNVVLR
jgi:phosphatidylinositol alpha 1,6-mannosyltransferase